MNFPSRELIFPLIATPHEYDLSYSDKMWPFLCNLWHFTLAFVVISFTFWSTQYMYCPLTGSMISCVEPNSEYVHTHRSGVTVGNYCFRHVTVTSLVATCCSIYTFLMSSYLNVQSCLIHIWIFLQWWKIRRPNISVYLQPVTFYSVNSLIFKRKKKT